MSEKDQATKIEELIETVNARMETFEEAPNEDDVSRMIKTAIDDLLEDDEFTRKFKFGVENGSDDRKLIGTKFARYGLSMIDVEFLYDLQESLRGQKRQKGGVHPGPSEELSNTFKAISTAIYLSEDELKRADKSAVDDYFATRVPTRAIFGKDLKLARSGDYRLTGAYESAIRAMDTAETGFGLELIGAAYVGDLWEQAARESRILDTIESFEMAHPTVYVPVEVDIPEMLFVAENTGPTDNPYATSKTGSERVQIDAKKLIIHQVYSGEMEEDSIIPFVPFLRRQQVLSLQYYGDSLVLNGDTTNAGSGNINLDDADPADTKHYLAFDGIRHAFLVDQTANDVDAGGAVTFEDLIRLRGKMIDATNLVDWGHPTNPTDLIYIADPETGDELSLLDEVKTMDVLGSMATVVQGQIAKIGQHPLISSIAMSKTEADGKVSNTGANNVKGQIALYNRRGFKWGWRRRVRVETERLPGRDQTRIILSLRAGFGRFTPSGAASGIESAAGLTNITLG